MSEPARRDAIDLSPVESDLRHHVQLYWKAYALQGAAQLALGLLAVAAPFAATYLTVLFFGLILVGAALAALVGALTMRAAGLRTTLVFSVVVLLLGLTVLFDPFAGAVSLTVLLAVFFLVSAVANYMLARALRHVSGRSLLLFLAAALNIVLAVYLVVGLPDTAVFAIGLFLGLSFLLSGAGLLAAALGTRDG